MAAVAGNRTAGAHASEAVRSAVTPAGVINDGVTVRTGIFTVVDGDVDLPEADLRAPAVHGFRLLADASDEVAVLPDDGRTEDGRTVAADRLLNGGRCGRLRINGSEKVGRSPLGSTRHALVAQDVPTEVRTGYGLTGPVRGNGP